MTGRQRLLATGMLGLAASLAGAQAPPQVQGSEPTPAQAVQPAQVQHKALEVLLAAAQDRNPFIRSNVIEAMHPLPRRALPLAQRGLGDPSPVVRFAAAVTAGRLKLTSLRPALLPLLKDENASVRAAALYSLYRLGAKVNLTPLAEYLTSKDPGTRANAAMLVGLLGDASAVPMLKQAVSAPMPRVSAQRAAVVRMQFAEAIVLLGDDSELNTLRAGAYNQFGEVRVVAINAMGAAGDQRMAPALRHLLAHEPAEVILAAAGALARLGDEQGKEAALAYTGAENPLLRAQAAWVLGYFSDGQTFHRLAQLLEDPVLQVRVTAAASVVRRTAAPAASPARPATAQPVDR